MRFLLDTNVISELRKGQRADKLVLNWQSKVQLKDQFISVVTLFELRLGIALKARNDIKAGKILLAWYQDKVKPAYKGRTFSVNETISEEAALLNVPNPKPFRDLLIAATAAEHGLTVVTRNSKDFKGLGVKIINPWKRSRG